VVERREGKKIIAGHQPHYLPWIGYFNKIHCADRFCLVDSIQYNKKWFQNSGQILTQAGPLWLTVPVKTKGHFDQNINEVLIDNGSNWQRKHWKTIMLAYQKAPYFKNYKDFFEDIYAQKWEKLVDLNEHIIRGVLEFLNIEKDIMRSSKLGTTGKKTDLLIDICKKSGSDGYLSGGGGARQYVDLVRFKEAELLHFFQDFHHPVYPQQPHGDFVEKMSIVDLLFNCGHGSGDIVKKSGIRTL